MKHNTNIIKIKKLIYIYKLTFNPVISQYFFFGKTDGGASIFESL